MESLAICGPSAFRYHRTPPQILGLYPAVSNVFNDSNHIKRSTCPLVAEVLRTPIHRFSVRRSDQNGAKLYRTHVYAGELPFGCFAETDHGLSVASPLFTLFTLAPHVSRIHLLMAMYEFCGSFSVFKPSAQAEEMLLEAERQGSFPLGYGWKRVVSHDGTKTDLWKRPPIIQQSELSPFASMMEGRHGSKAFRWASEHITGICASPFEVQASILLGLPRRLGGMGIALQNNVRIPLSSQARALYPHSCCYADLYIAAGGNHPAIDIECQGRSVHDSEKAGLSDSDRFAAIESMGIQVVPLTYPQFSVRPSFEAAMKLIAEKMGRKPVPKTPAQQSVETRVRSEVFIDWNTLASDGCRAGKRAA